MKLHRRLSLCLASIALAATLVSAARAQGDKNHAAVKPMPRSEQWWQERHATIDDRLKQTDTQLVFIGDSITQGWEGGGKNVWEKFYGPRKAVNMGIGGDRTQHVLWRLEHGNFDLVKPKLAVVMIGTNNSNGEDNSVAEIADGVRAVVSKLRQKLPATKIILLDIFPRGQQPNPQRGKICQVNQVIARLHDGRDVFFAPIGHHFLADDGSLSPEIMPDSLHLSPRGYEIWAQALEPHLKALLSDSAR